jgi:hypothetical protein
MDRRVTLPLAVVTLLGAYACKPISHGPGAPAPAKATAAAVTLAPSGEFMVYVPQLNMRANPNNQAKVLKVLKRGTMVRAVSAEVTDALEGHDAYEFWREVAVDGTIGWVADDYIISKDLYEAFREADERGRAGDAEGMRRGLDKAIKNYRPPFQDGGANMLDIQREDSARRGIWHQYVSPDGTKIVVVGEWAYLDWGGGYPNHGRIGTGVPVLCFENGKGLVDHFQSMEEMTGTWSPDSRFFAYAEDPVTEFGYQATLMLIDMSSWNRVEIGRLTHAPAAHRYEFGFAGGYLLWVDEEAVKEPGPPPLEKDSATPLLLAYEFATGRKSKLLKADLNTLRSDETQVEGWGGIKFYKVKMVTVDPCPESVKRSKLYSKYSDDNVLAVNREVYNEDMAP